MHYLQTREKRIHWVEQSSQQMTNLNLMILNLKILSIMQIQKIDFLPCKCSILYYFWKIYFEKIFFFTNHRQLWSGDEVSFDLAKDFRNENGLVATNIKRIKGMTILWKAYHFGFYLLNLMFTIAAEHSKFNGMIFGLHNHTVFIKLYGQTGDFPFDFSSIKFSNYFQHFYY